MQCLLFNQDYSSRRYFSSKNRWQRRDEGKIKNYWGGFPPFLNGLSRGTWHSWGLKHSCCHGGFTEVVCRSVGQFPGCASCWKAASRLYQGTATVSQKNPQSLAKLSVNVRPSKGKFLLLQPIFLKAFTHQTVVHHKMVLHINGERCHELLQSLAKTQEISFSSQDAK